MGTKTKVICGDCGHIEERTDVKSDEVYFPYRYVRDNDGFGISCSNCGDNGNMVIFGRNLVSGRNGFSLLKLPHVQESNKIWQEAQDEQALARKKEDGIRLWQRAYEVTQRTQKNYKTRLKELETWDKVNGNADEREAKIEALNRLIKK